MTDKIKGNEAKILEDAKVKPRKGIVVDGILDAGQIVDMF